MLCPLAACLLHLVPVSTIERRSLWTHIGEEKRVVHCCATPLIITSRTHVSAVVSRTHIIEIHRSWLRYVKIFMEFRFSSFCVASKMGFSKMPRHPVGDTTVRVIRNCITRSLKHYLRSFLQRSGHFKTFNRSLRRRFLINRCFIGAIAFVLLCYLALINLTAFSQTCLQALRIAGTH